MLKTKRFAYYYEPFENTAYPNDDIPALIDLHAESFERYGWEVFRVDESTAQKHPKYEIFDNPQSPLSWSANQWTYTRACYMKWLAYSVSGGFFADYDVINYGFTTTDAEMVLAQCDQQDPIFLSMAGAVGLFNPDAYNKIIQTYIDFINRPVVEGAMLEDVNDMTIMRQLRPKWYDGIPYTDARYSKDYTNSGWHESKLVHFPYHYTKSPRAETVKSAKPLG